MYIYTYIYRHIYIYMYIMFCWHTRMRFKPKRESIEGKHGNDFGFYRVVEKESLIASLRQ